MSAEKRRRVLSPPGQPLHGSQSKQVSVLELPTELLAAVFRLCPYRQVAENLRLVCRRFSFVATEVLNSGLATLGSFIERAMARTEQALMRVRTEGELLSMSRTYNALEIIQSQFRLVQAVTWRYVSHDWSGHSARGCFYGGRLLDLFIGLVRMARTDPGSLGCAFHFHHQDRENTSRQQLLNLANRFMFNFEKFTERKLNKSPSVSGARVVDVLDCLHDENARRVDWRNTHLDHDTGTYHYHASYVVPRSWFTCLDSRVRNTRTLPWPDEQRFMYLRLRRLVSNVNEHSQEQVHYDREVLIHFQSPSPLTVAAPLVSSYTGYGQCERRFFFYGNMNLSAYESRFIRNNQSNQDLEDALSVGIDSEHNKPPCFDLHINVKLVCPMHLAPLAVYETFKLSDYDFQKNTSREECNFHLHVTFQCPVSSTSRLPSIYHWDTANKMQ